jgi:hypothetical protein
MTSSAAAAEASSTGGLSPSTGENSQGGHGGGIYAPYNMECRVDNGAAFNKEWVTVRLGSREAGNLLLLGRPSNIPSAALSGRRQEQAIAGQSAASVSVHLPAGGNGSLTAGLEQVVASVESGVLAGKSVPE